jgi:FkbM family methyltransferase
VAAIPGVPELVAELDRPLVVLDVGCRWGLDARWLGLGRHARLIGFDADADECLRLRNDAAPHAGTYVAAALGAEPGPARLYLTAEPACSSLYPPDPELLAERPEVAGTSLRGSAVVDVTTLDSWASAAGVGEVDFIKLDVQGSELDVLRGAPRLLATVRALDIEVEFNPLYQGQPLFGDVDRFLRERGFVLWRLGHFAHYGLPGGLSDFPCQDWQFFDSQPVPVASRGGQVFWGHAVFVRREMAHGQRPAGRPQAIRDALVASVLGFEDLAARARAPSGP